MLQESDSMNLIGPGKVAVVTGGARGIGLAAARLLADEGAHVALVDLDRDGAVRAAKALAEEIQTEAIGIGADITIAADVVGFVGAVIERFGQIDIFINSAAVLDDKRFLDSGPQDWDRMLKVCLYGPMSCLRAILPGMVERKYGRVVCMASDAARIGQARLSYYAAAKAGVIALVKSLAQEVAGDGVTLNVVSPGATNTELRREREAAMLRQMGAERYERRAKSIVHMYPLGRIGEPSDIAAMVAFLASDHASWITGQVVSVNGGFTMP
jgi:NAD(P)-dependent dehydrogenase (short-subunit alcohol dehydrogenase family)